MIDLNILSNDEYEYYKLISKRLPESLTQSDLSIFIILYCILARYLEVKLDEFDDELNISKASEKSLKLISLLIGYEWDKNSSVEINRHRLLYNQYRRKIKGTITSLKTLVRNDSLVTFNSNELNSKVKIHEDDHKISVELPSGLRILRSDLKEVRPAGTLIDFIYNIVLDYIIYESRIQSEYSLTICQNCDSIERIYELGMSNLLSSLYYRPIVITSTNHSMYKNSVKSSVIVRKG